MSPKKIEAIKHIDFNNASSWKSSLFITFDLDWASDEVLKFTLELVEKYNIKATFFVTHNTKVLEKAKKNYEI